MKGVRKEIGNHSSELPWLVSFTLKGEVIRKRFATEAEGIAYREQLEADHGVVRGVSYDTYHKLWEAALVIDGVRMRERFKTKQEAVAKRKHWESLEKSPKQEYNCDRLKQRAKVLRQLERLGWDAKRKSTLRETI